MHMNDEGTCRIELDNAGRYCVQMWLDFLSQYINAIRKPALLYMHLEDFVMKYSCQCSTLMYSMIDNTSRPRLIYKQQAEVNKDKAIIKEPDSLMASKFFRM